MEQIKNIGKKQEEINSKDVAKALKAQKVGIKQKIKQNPITLFFKRLYIICDVWSKKSKYIKQLWKQVEKIKEYMEYMQRVERMIIWLDEVVFKSGNLRKGFWIDIMDSFKIENIYHERIFKEYEMTGYEKLKEEEFKIILKELVGFCKYLREKFVQNRKMRRIFVSKFVKEKKERQLVVDKINGNLIYKYKIIREKLMELEGK